MPSSSPSKHTSLVSLPKCRRQCAKSTIRRPTKSVKSEFKKQFFNNFFKQAANRSVEMIRRPPTHRDRNNSGDLMVHLSLNVVRSNLMAWVRVSGRSIFLDQKKASFPALKLNCSESSLEFIGLMAELPYRYVS